MSKLERLLNLTALLLQTERPVTIEQIGDQIPGYADEPASFRRTFERDKDDLREMNIPIEVVPLDPSDATVFGYRIPKDDYYLPDLDLTADELAALHLAAAAIKVSDRSEVETFRKLGGLPKAGESPDSAAELPFEPGLSELFSAVLEKRVVTFRYQSSERTIEPQRLDFQRGRWYVTGMDRDREAPRTFRLDRIDGEIEAGEAAQFEPAVDAVGVRLEPWKFGDDDPQQVSVRVDESHVSVARRAFVGADEMPPSEDGSVTFELTVSSWEPFRSVVVGLLEHAEVVAPPELRQKFVESIEGLVQ